MIRIKIKDNFKRIIFLKRALKTAISRMKEEMDLHK